jgi:hypothetical protein
VAKQILRKIDGWRFEAPLALLLGGAAGFAAIAMPEDVLIHVPLLGAMGIAGRAVIALGLGMLCGMAGYRVMRPPQPAIAKADPEIQEDVAEAQPEVVIVPPVARSERLRRFRRADAHPDAPPRAPIRASRDLGEPFMEVNTSSWPIDEGAEEDEAQAVADAPEAADAIPEADFTEVPEETPAIVAQIEPEPAPEPVEVRVEVRMAETESAFSAPMAETEAAVLDRPAAPTAVRRDGAPRPERQSLTDMIDRLSAGLERRSQRAGRAAGAAPGQPRDMRPAMREALEELNRLAAVRRS